jgi:hypothetical protein
VDRDHREGALDIGDAVAREPIDSGSRSINSNGSA